MAKRPILEIVRSDRPRNNRSAFADSRSDFWLQQFVSMGPTRTLERLSLLKNPDVTQPTPSLRTLKRWSSQDGWMARASAFDAEVNARAEEENLKKLSKGRVKREEDRLNIAAHFKRLVVDGFTVDTIDETRFRLTGERIVTGKRSKTFSELTKSEVQMMAMLHRTAEYTELLIDGKPTERIAHEGGDPEHPLIYEPMGPEKLDRLYAEIETMVKTIQAKQRKRTAG
jgi:hypothetical protein